MSTGIPHSPGTAAARQGQRRSVPRERRRWWRRPVNGEVRCDVLLRASGTPAPTVRDITPRGIGLWLTYRVQPGVILPLALRNRSDLYEHHVRLCVVHCTCADGGGFVVGGTFLEPLGPEAFRMLLH